MLSEGFLTVLPYRYEKKVPSTAEPQGSAHTHAHTFVREDPQHGGPSQSIAGDRSRAASMHTGPYMAELGPNESLGPSSASPPKVGLPILGCSPALDHCSADLHSAYSLIRQYPDLRLRQEQDEATSRHGTVSCDSLSVSPLVSGLPLRASIPSSKGPERQKLVTPGTSIPDQGYLVMSGNPSLGLPVLGLEPMSNSLLNCLLEKQLDEVYRQHLTDSLARCNSQLGHSLLRGLVPPPQPGGQAQGSDSMEASLEAVGSGDRCSIISYLNTNSHFSSPVLRISEAESAQ